MAHSANVISKIKLPSMPAGVEAYELHDAEAYHGTVGTGTLTVQTNGTTKGTFNANATGNETINITPADLGLGKVMNFMGVEAYSVFTADTSVKKGDVYIANDTEHANKEYICIADNNPASENNFEEFGPAISLDGYVTKAQHNAHVHSVTVSGTASAASALSATASIAAEKVVTSLTTGGIGANVGAVAVGVDGTVAAVTGFKGAHTTAAAITELDSTTVNSASASDVNIDKYSFTSKTASKATAATAISVPNTTAGTAVEVAKAGTAKNIPNVTSVGSASTFDFEVNNGILEISGDNSVAPTLGTAISITPAVSNGSVVPAVAGTAISIPQYTFADVTSSLATKDATGYVASKVTTSEVTVATATPAATANAITALSAFDTENAAKGVKVTTQPTVSIVADASGYSVVTGGTKGAVSNIPVSGTAAAQSFNVTVDTGTPKSQL